MRDGRSPVRRPAQAELGRGTRPPILMCSSLTRSFHVRFPWINLIRTGIRLYLNVCCIPLSAKLIAALRAADGTDRCRSVCTACLSGINVCSHVTCPTSRSRRIAEVNMYGFGAGVAEDQVVAVSTLVPIG